MEGRYDKHHARGRSIVERSFGILKTRWRAISQRYLEIRSLLAPQVVGACCILHNICMAAGDILEEEGDPVEADDRALSGNGRERGCFSEESSPIRGRF